MSDFEDRLSGALASAAGGAPAAGGLVDGARRRLRRRRTTWAAGAAVLVAMTVPAGLALAGGGAPSPDGGVAAGGTTPQPSVPPAGWRVETWHDVTLQVPDDWGHGGVDDWCADGTSLAEAHPGVVRPDTVVLSIGCTPATGYGVTFGPADGFDAAYASGHVWQYDAEGVDQQVYPAGAWLGVWYGAETVVTVATPDRSLTRRVVDSVRSVDGADPHGCPPDLGAAEAARRSPTAAVGVSLCRYDETDRLASSSRRLDAAAARTMAILTSAPVRTGVGRCADPVPGGRTAVLEDGAYVATVVIDTCEGWDGVFFSGVAREVTDEVRDLVLSLG